MYVLCLFSLGLFLFPSQGLSIEITPEEISRIAENGKESFMAAIALDYYTNYGIYEDAALPVIELEDALNPNTPIHMELKKRPAVILGEPFQVYTIYSEDILNWKPGIDLSTILVPTTKWFVPVFIRHKPKAMLTVDYVDGTWKVVSIGIGDVSEKVDKITKAGIKGRVRKNKFIRIHPALSDFIVVDVDGKQKILPFSYSIDALGIEIFRADSLGLYDLSDIMLRLVDRIKNSLMQ
jgi:hypothetical protein